MIVTYTPQHNNKPMDYDNDTENNIVKVMVDGELITHDLNGYQQSDDPEHPNLPGFPIVGEPKYVDGELHVKLIQWYR